MKYYETRKPQQSTINRSTEGLSSVPCSPTANKLPTMKEILTMKPTLLSPLSPLPSPFPAFPPRLSQIKLNQGKLSQKFIFPMIHPNTAARPTPGNDAFLRPSTASHFFLKIIRGTRVERVLSRRQSRSPSSALCPLPSSSTLAKSAPFATMKLASLA